MNNTDAIRKIRGNPAYNVSKAGVKVITENLSHELRTQGTKVTAHLFVCVPLLNLSKF